MSRRVCVILGMHNSGTSLLAKIAQDIGIVLGPDVLTREKLGSAAPKYDYWEHAGITEAQDRILHRLDRHWSAPNRAEPIAPEAFDSDDIAPLRAEIIGHVRRELDRTEGIWGFKDPRTVRLMPLWHRIFRELDLDPFYLVSLRAPSIVARSFASKGQVPLVSAEALWRRHYLEALAGTEGRPRLFSDYQDWLDDPHRALAQLAAFTGLAIPDDRLADIVAGIDPGVSDHQRGSGAQADPHSVAVYEACRRVAAGEVVDVDSVRRLISAEPTMRIPGLDADQADIAPDPSPRRVCIVTAELTGPVRNGGIGTAFTGLALALAEAGHGVTVLYTPGQRSDEGTIDDWVRHYGRLGVELVPLPEGAAVVDWLAGRSFEVVHFHDWLGLAGPVIEAKRQGHFAGSQLAVHTHGPSRWVLEANGLHALGHSQPEIDAIERAAIAGADLLVSPSAYLVDWMQARGWTLPTRVAVQQNVYPHETAAVTVIEPGLPEELVFFGRLETRKGLVTFLEALDLLAARRPLPGIAFLGRITQTVDGAGDEVVRRWAERHAHPVEILADLDRRRALDYLRGGRRLAIVPSVTENSPFTILECLLEGIPFLASRVGGIPELIAAPDRARTLFEAGAEALAERMEDALASGVAPARPALSPTRNREVWLGWHRRLPRIRHIEAPPSLAVRLLRRVERRMRTR